MRPASPAPALLLGTLLLFSPANPMAVAPLHAQAAAAKTGIDDSWQGTLHAEKDLRLVLKIVKGPDGVLRSQFFSIDQGGRPVPVKETTFQGGDLRVNVEAIDGVYTGKLSGDTITGSWKQGDKAQPLILLRATTETAWAIPEPPPRLPPMDPKADPSFDVATIKLSEPNSPGKWFGGPAGKFQTHNTTLNDLMMFAYNVHSKQIIGAPGWYDTEKFDIVAKPDTPGQPSEAQTRSMMRKLLESRFGLKFHGDKKELSAYVLTVAKGGPKLTKSEADENVGSSFNFGKLGRLRFRNISMDGFAHWMQAGVFDRPVVDHTNLPGRFDGSLNWTPDETQFAVFGVKIVPDDSPDAPPPVFTAIQEQIGLKLDATKTAVDVMVIDHMEKPSEN